MRVRPAQLVDYQRLTGLKVFLPGASLGKKFCVFVARKKNGQSIA